MYHRDTGSREALTSKTHLYPFKPCVSPRVHFSAYSQIKVYGHQGAADQRSMRNLVFLAHGLDLGLIPVSTITANLYSLSSTLYCIYSVLCIVCFQDPQIVRYRCTLRRAVALCCVYCTGVSIDRHTSSRESDQGLYSVSNPSCFDHGWVYTGYSGGGGGGLGGAAAAAAEQQQHSCSKIVRCNITI